MDNTTLASEPNEPAVVKFVPPAEIVCALVNALMPVGYSPPRSAESNARTKKNKAKRRRQKLRLRALEADAKLRAAAPEMLAVIQRHLAGNLGTFDEMKSVVAKATGGADR